MNIKTLNELYIILDILKLNKKEGTIEEFIHAIENHTRSAKFRILKHLILIKVLEPKKEILYGKKRILMIYSINQKKFYKHFIDSELGESLREMYETHAVIHSESWKK